MTKWMQEAVKRPGALTRKARELHETPLEFAETHAHAPGLPGRQARFALVAQGKPIPPASGAGSHPPGSRARAASRKSETAQTGVSAPQSRRRAVLPSSAARAQ